MESNVVIVAGDKGETNSMSYDSLEQEYADQRHDTADRMQTPTIKNISSANSKASNSTIVHRERYWSRPSLNSNDDSNRRQSKQDKEVTIEFLIHSK